MPPFWICCLSSRDQTTIPTSFLLRICVHHTQYLYRVNVHFIGIYITQKENGLKPLYARVNCERKREE